MATRGGARGSTCWRMAGEGCRFQGAGGPRGRCCCGMCVWGGWGGGAEFVSTRISDVGSWSGRNPPPHLLLCVLFSDRPQNGCPRDGGGAQGGRLYWSEDPKYPGHHPAYPLGLYALPPQGGIRPTVSQGVAPCFHQGRSATPQHRALHTSPHWSQRGRSTTGHEGHMGPGSPMC